MGGGFLVPIKEGQHTVQSALALSGFAVGTKATDNEGLRPRGPCPPTLGRISNRAQLRWCRPCPGESQALFQVQFQPLSSPSLP